MDDAHRTIETVVRESYGRLVAYLSARSRDVAAAEDALADAVVAALRTWPADGIPGKPEAWLLAAARHRLIDRARHERVRADSADALRIVLVNAERMAASAIFPDERLKLLFVCAHPSIDRSIHTPLMLQVVLGLDAATIAGAFLTSAAAMGQRLSRAKTKIRDARVAFEIPDPRELPPRVEAVLDAIYAAYGTGWDDFGGANPRRRGLTHEATWLARVLVDLLPGEPEARGLLALVLYCEARRPARRDSSGAYVPISEQDARLWAAPMIQEAEQVLATAAAQRRSGRFQLEAALQSAYVDGARTGRIDWRGIAVLYEGLVRVAPTVGALVGRAAALAEANGSEAGLARLDEMPADAVKGYQPYWAVRAHLAQQLGRVRDALDAFDRAIALTEDDGTRQFLQRRRGHAVESAARQ